MSCEIPRRFLELSHPRMRAEVSQEHDERQADDRADDQIGGFGGRRGFGAIFTRQDRGGGGPGVGFGGAGFGGPRFARDGVRACIRRGPGLRVSPARWRFVGSVRCRAGRGIGGSRDVGRGVHEPFAARSVGLGSGVMDGRRSSPRFLGVGGPREQDQRRGDGEQWWETARLHFWRGSGRARRLYRSRGELPHQLV